MTDFVC